MTATSPLPAHLLPANASVDNNGHLTIAGLRAVDLAAEFGTPVFVYDRDEIVANCAEAVSAFGSNVSYASKAFLCKEMARIVNEAGMRMDVSTGGELYVAHSAGFPCERIVFHGNNKSVDELDAALALNVGTIVVDSFDEIDRLSALCKKRDTTARVMVRVTPGVVAHTHEFIRTGQDDSKFGFRLSTGDALEATKRVKTQFEFAGIHMHIGSQVFSVESYAEALGVIAPFIHDVQPEELCIGGGLGVAYVEGDEAATISQWANVIAGAAKNAGIEATISAEPGRSIVARAGITLYTVGTIKHLEGIRTYVAVDGGMSDNPRPVLYGSGYETLLARNVFGERPREVRVVGKHCESGDVLVSNGRVPNDLCVGDILATPVTGAYGASMGSNYNKILRPPVVFVSAGEAEIVVRREKYSDLVQYDR